MKTYGINQIFLVGLMILLFAIGAKPVFGGENSMISDDNDSPEYTLNETIVHKRPEYVLTEESNKYVVDSDTSIFDTSGRLINLMYLAFPCEAKIVFSGPQGGKYYAREIVILNELPDSSNEWSPPIPK